MVDSENVKNYIFIAADYVVMTSHFFQQKLEWVYSKL